MKILGLIPTRPFSMAFLAVTIVVLSSLTNPVIGQSSTIVQQRIKAACQFLISLYNPALQLVKTKPSSNVYYISRDNLLAKNAFAYCNKSIGQNITESVRPAAALATTTCTNLFSDNRSLSQFTMGPCIE